MDLSWRLEAPTCYQTQHFVMIQLLLILMTNAERVEDRKKKKQKQANKRKRKVCPLEFIFMENKIRAASKHTPVVQKMAMRGAIN